MFVWWIARPVSARRVHLDHHNFLGGKAGRHYVHDLPRSISAAPELLTTSAAGSGAILVEWMPAPDKRKLAIGLCLDSEVGRLSSGRSHKAVHQIHCYAHRC